VEERATTAVRQRKGSASGTERERKEGRGGRSAEGGHGEGRRRHWSERENRQSDGGTETEGDGEVSPLGRASACSLRRTPGTVFPARTQVREPV
jgi:hypothetical protein